jgi:paraquat-inducible protein B
MLRKTALLSILLIALTACRSQGIQVNVTFDSLSGLAKDDPVLFEGNHAGRVEAVQYNPDGHYTVRVLIDKGFVNTATEYSQFSVVDDPARDSHEAIRIQLSQQGGKPLPSGATVAGTSSETDFSRLLQEQLQAGFAFFKEQVEKFGRDVQQIPETEQYKQLKKSLEDLAAEIDEAQKQTREEIKREWLPKIQKELDDLREKLKQSGREKELQPLDREVDRIRRI